MSDIPSQEPIEADYERILDPNDDIALEATQQAITASLRYINAHDVISRGDSQQASPSLLPPGITERMENRMACDNALLRRKYFTLFALRGGEEAVDVSRRFFAQMGDAIYEEHLTQDQLDDLQAASHPFAWVGGLPAYHAVNQLRCEVADKRAEEIMGRAATRLYLSRVKTTVTVIDEGSPLKKPE